MHELDFFYFSDECNVYLILGNYACHIIAMLAPEYLIMGNGKLKNQLCLFGNRRFHCANMKGVETGTQKHAAVERKTD